MECYHKSLSVWYNILLIENNIYVETQKYKTLNHKINTDDNY